MVNDSSPTLIVAVPGTQETQEMPRAAVIEAIRKGEIRADQWIWSPAHNDWKQVSELPELNEPPVPAPAPVSTPAPTPAAPSVFMAGKVPGAISIPAAATPVKVAMPVAQAAAQPRPVSMAAHTAGVVSPKAAVSTATPSATSGAKTRFSQKMEVKEEFPIFKVLFGVMFLLVAGVVAGNYLYVDSPLTGNMSNTPYASVTVYGHLGAFVQPGALVIHIPPTADLNSNNMANFLATLARNTPPRPFSSSSFDGVGLTSAWQSQYVFNGADWTTLGQMSKVTVEDRRKFELEHLQLIDGTPLLKIKNNEDPAAVTEAEDKAWAAFVTNFLPKKQ